MNEGIRHNLRFLVAELTSQLAYLETFFVDGSATVARRISDRGGYAHNLRARIHESCLKQLSECKEGDPRILVLRALELIASQLDRIAELCRECVRQLAGGERSQYLDPDALAPLLRQVVAGVELIEPSLDANDSRKALELEAIERRLDRAYQKLMRRHIADLKDSRNPKDVIAALFVAHHVEEMGDALLRIGESIISVNLGQPVDMGRYHALRASVARLDAEEGLGELEIATIAETRSGSSISGISAPGSDGDAYVAIFKDGRKRKLKEEKQGVKSWRKIYPGLAPRILSYHKRGQSAALLIEHLAGLTFEQILLHEPPELLQQAVDRLSDTLRRVWKETRNDKSIRAGFMQQTQKRMNEVYAVHPEFRRGDSEICGVPLASFDELLAQTRSFEKSLQSPFSVYIHGDFNVDNIIFDPLEKRISFIDLHRSRYMDYVQDVSVFMVSNYRLQILDVPLRRRIMLVAQAFYRFAAQFARKSGDETFELRLALGLARSFATSTRFILDKSLARGMFLRARYLMEQVVRANPHKPGGFSVPVEEIFIG